MGGGVMGGAGRLGGAGRARAAAAALGKEEEAEDGGATPLKVKNTFIFTERGSLLLIYQTRRTLKCHGNAAAGDAGG